MNDRPHPSLIFLIAVALGIIAAAMVVTATGVARISDSLERMGK